MLILHCDKCNKDLDYITVDGYHFGDRMLEGVQYRFTKAGRLNCTLDWKTDSYLQQLNENYWQLKANESAKYIDMGTCPFCKEDVYVDDDEKDEILV